MTTTFATSLAAGNAATASASLSQELKQQLGGAEPSLVMVFASTDQPLAEVTRRLAAQFPSAVLLGSSTAGEFTEKQDAKRAVAAVAVAADYRVFAGMGTGLKASPEGAIAAALEGLPSEVNGYPHRTAIMLLDPLSGNGEEATLIAAAMLGPDTRLAGGAAGDDLAMKETHVACGTLVANDAVVIAVLFSKSPLGVGVCHGHVPLSKNLTVTKAAGSTVYEVDGRPAWEVWAEQTRAHAKQSGVDVDALSGGDLGAFLLRYEAGLATGEEYKIRAPLSRTDDGAIGFACGIPQGAVVQITESVPARQIDSAREAARRARAQLGAKKAAGAIVFDCICRNLILKADFQTAVRAMSKELGDVPLAGFETYGEIALDVGDMSGFHNTTSVVLAFPEEG